MLGVVRVGLALVGCAGGPGPEAPSAFLVQKTRPWPPLTPKVDGSASGSRLWLEIRHTRLTQDRRHNLQACGPPASEPLEKGDGEGGHGNEAHASSQCGQGREPEVGSCHMESPEDHLSQLRLCR